MRQQTTGCGRSYKIYTERMLKNRCLAMLTGVALGFANPANACPVEMTPHERIELDYTLGLISASALVEITSAEYIRDTTEPEPLWRATATVEKVLLGKITSTEVYFEHGHEICDEIYPIPKVADRWVVYFSDPSDVVALRNSYPASVALEADARLKLNGN